MDFVSDEISHKRLAYVLKKGYLGLLKPDDEKPRYITNKDGIMVQ